MGIILLQNEIALVFEGQASNLVLNMLNIPYSTDTPSPQQSSRV